MSWDNRVKRGLHKAFNLNERLTGHNCRDAWRVPSTQRVLEERVARLKREGKRRHLSGFLIATAPNMKYFAGVSVVAIERFAGVMIPIDSDPAIVVPELEEEKVKSSSAIKNIRKYSDAEGPEGVVKSMLKELRLTRGKLGVEDFLPYKFSRMIKRTAPKVELDEASEVLAGLRTVKTPDELELMRRAASIISQGIDAGIKAIRVGATELDIGFEIERTIKQSGGESVPFCIVLRGENAALPHGSSSKAEVRTGDAVVMDVGAIYDGYYGDLTKTVFVGSASAKQREIYDIVLQAQTKAIESVKPGIRASVVDKTARDIITKAGYGERFTHRTGHGLGLEVHEEPSITATCKTVLKPGMTFTVEPGIYLPQEFGVRIEDNIVVTEEGRMTIGACEKTLTIV
jgi:Xaa-Pro aminopeptidase